MRKTPWTECLWITVAHQTSHSIHTDGKPFMLITMTACKHTRYVHISPSRVLFLCWCGHQASHTLAESLTPDGRFQWFEAKLFCRNSKHVQLGLVRPQQIIVCLQHKTANVKDVRKQLHFYKTEN